MAGFNVTTEGSLGGVYIEVRPGMRNWYGHYFDHAAALRISDMLLSAAADVERGAEPDFRGVPGVDGFGRVALIISKWTHSVHLSIRPWKREYEISLAPGEALDFAFQLWVAACDNSD